MLDLFKDKQSLFVEEISNSIKNNKITVYEPSGSRKDRYSSIAYNYWCASQLELQLRPYNQDTESLVQRLTIKKGHFHFCLFHR